MNRHLITALTAIRDAADFCLPGPSTDELIAELRGMPKSWDRPIPTAAEAIGDGWVAQQLQDPSVQMAYTEEVMARGAEDERAAVVAYMRDVADTATGLGREGEVALDSTADAIESGEHVREVSGGG